MLGKTFLALADQMAGRAVLEVVAAALQTTCMTMRVFNRPADMRANHKYPAHVRQNADDGVAVLSPFRIWTQPLCNALILYLV